MWQLQYVYHSVITFRRELEGVFEEAEERIIQLIKETCEINSFPELWPSL